MSDIPEGDAQEQRRGAAGHDENDDEHVGHRAGTRSNEVPEADAAEQDQVVPDDEDEID